MFDIVQNLNKLQNHVYDTVRRKKLQCYFFDIRACEYLCCHLKKDHGQETSFFYVRPNMGKKLQINQVTYLNELSKFMSLVDH